MVLRRLTGRAERRSEGHHRVSPWTTSIDRIKPTNSWYDTKSRWSGHLLSFRGSGVEDPPAYGSPGPDAASGGCRTGSRSPVAGPSGRHSGRVLQAARHPTAPAIHAHDDPGVLNTRLVNQYVGPSLAEGGTQGLVQQPPRDPDHHGPLGKRGSRPAGWFARLIDQIPLQEGIDPACGSAQVPLGRTAVSLVSACTRTGLPVPGRAMAWHPCGVSWYQGPG